MKLFKTIIILLVISGALLLSWSINFRKIDNFELVSIKQSHTYVYTSSDEFFVIPLLVNHQKSHHLIKEAITSVKIQSAQSDEQFTLEIVEFAQQGPTLYRGKKYDHINLNLQLNFHVDDFTLNIEKALLIITYIEGDALVIPIGEFNYIFPTTNDNDISVHSRYNVHEYLETFSTSVGVIIAIENKTNDLIHVNKLSLNLSEIKPDICNAKISEGTYEPHQSLSSLLDDSYEIVGEPQDCQTSITIHPFEIITLIVPFKYHYQEALLHRYPLIIEYTYLNQAKIHIEDDFLFIKTDHFGQESKNHVIVESH